MAELFVIGTFWFWTLVAVEIILLFVFCENENGVGATISILVFAGLLQWMGNTDIIGFIAENPMRFVAMVVSYFFAGAVWGTIKWWLFVKNKIEDIKEGRDNWFESRNYTFPPISGSKEEREWVEVKEQRGWGRPQIKDHKADFVRWMSFWWISMIWSIFADFIKGICKEIYRRLAKFLQTMSDNMWAKAGLDD